MENIKQSIVKDTGIVLTVLTTLKISQNLKLNLVYILEKFVVGQRYQSKSRKTKLLMASTILLQLIQQMMVWLIAFRNQQKLKLYKHEGNIPSFLFAQTKNKWGI
mgnify:CR=1 FL=1